MIPALALLGRARLVDRPEDGGKTFHEAMERVSNHGSAQLLHWLFTPDWALAAFEAGDAKRLFLSERTARNHVSSILAKLELRNRADVARWATEHALLQPQSPPTVSQPGS